MWTSRVESGEGLKRKQFIEKLVLWMLQQQKTCRTAHNRVISNKNTPYQM